MSFDFNQSKYIEDLLKLISLSKKLIKSKLPKGSFTEDRIICSLLIACPSSILSVVFLFSAGYFGSGILEWENFKKNFILIDIRTNRMNKKFPKKTCSLTDTPIPNKNGTLFAGCDNYRLADYQFITSYCYARMYGFELGFKKFTCPKF